MGSNTKRFKRTLICFNTDTQFAKFRGNPLYQAQNDTQTTDKWLKTMKNERKILIDLPSTKQAVKSKPKHVFFFHFSLFLTIYLLFKCRFVA